MDRIRALLRAADDPRHLERPADFDKTAALDRFDRLVTALRDRFGPSCTGALGQDASFYGVIEVPAAANGTGAPMSVAMSNFGRFFVTASLRSDGADTAPPREVVTWLDEVCTAMGCTFVPIALLREPYDGPSVLLAAGDLELAAALAAAGIAEDDEEPGGSDWHDRYFEYM